MTRKVVSVVDRTIIPQLSCLHQVTPIRRWTHTREIQLSTQQRTSPTIKWVLQMCNCRPKMPPKTSPLSQNRQIRQTTITIGKINNPRPRLIINLEDRLRFTNNAKTSNWPGKIGQCQKIQQKRFPNLLNLKIRLSPKNLAQLSELTL